MSQPAATSRQYSFLQLIIFLAGFTFLVYEVSWNRLLSLVLGSTVTASTLVLASFMAGFGGGAYFWGRRAVRSDRTGRLLALLIGGVGVFSALDLVLFRQAIPALYGILPATGFADTVVFVLAAGLLLVPAFLMGSVFPLVSQLAVVGRPSVSATLGRLYAVETLGSTVGGLVTGFVLLGVLGQQATVLLAVAIDLGLAIWLLAADRSGRLAAPPETGAPPAAPSRSVSRRQRKQASADPAALRRSALTGAFVCGLAMLALQVLWMRMFRIYFTNTSYTFALVSSLVILGLFTGSLVFERRSRSLTDPQRSLVRSMVLMAAMAGLGLIVLVRMPQLLMFPFQDALGDPLVRVLVLPALASLLVVFPPAAFSGYAFPLACSMYAEGRRTVGRDVGLVLMVNTSGSVLGPVAAAFLLLPLLGAGQAVLLVVMILVWTAAFILHRWAPAGTATTPRTALYTAAALLGVVLMIGPTLRILPPSFARYDRDILFYEESVEGTLSVGQDRDTRARAKYTFVNNSAVIGSTYDAIKVVKMVGHFPFFMGLECRDVLVIGFGIGVTTSAIAAHPEVESIECVELVPGLAEAAVFYRDLNHGVVDDPRLTIRAGDGRHVLQRSNRRYDLISCDPTHPILGSGNLYTRDYFELCRDHLTEGGMVSQYLPLHKLGTEEFLGLIATFHAVFPHSTVWLGHYHAVLLGSLKPLSVDFADWQARVDALPRDEHFYGDPYHLAATLMLDGPAIARLGADSPLNTDDRSYTEFFAPDCLDADNLVKNIRFFMDNRVALDGVFTNVGDPQRLARFVAGNQLLSEGLYHQLGGDMQQSRQALQRACEVNPENQEYPFLIQLYF